MKSAKGIFGGCWVCGAVLIELKIAGVINWSWLSVTSPIWGPFALIFAALAVLLILKGILKALNWMAEAVKKL